MSLWRQLSRGLYSLTHGKAADRDVEAELRHYFDEATDELIQSGASPDEARRRVRIALGSPRVAHEQVRASGWETLVSTTLADARHSLRRLLQAPGFAILSVLTLAIGIGASTAIFSAVNPILFEPLPYRQPDRIITVWDRGVDNRRLDVTFGTYREILERNRSLDAVAVMKPWLPIAMGSDLPERLTGQRVSSGYFRVLSVSPALGREFLAGEDLPNGPRVVILSDRLWRRRFSADPGILGRTITLDDVSYTVVGIMPAGFESVESPAADAWAPLQYNPALPLDGREWGHHLHMVARVRDEVAVTQAQRELDTIASTPLSGFVRAPWAAIEGGFIVTTLKEDVTASVKPALLAVLSAVALMLAIACVNVTNLMLARGVQRRGEFAVRAALGASRVRMVRHLLTETLLVTGLGGTLGMIVAALSVSTVVALSPAALPRVDAIRVDTAALLCGLLITTLVGVAIGLLPAFRASATNLRIGVQGGSPRVAGDHHVIRRVLVVAEVALALVLLVSTGLLMRSMQRLFSISPGFNAAHLLTMQVQTSGRRFDKRASDRFFAQAAEAVRRVPGVTAAAFTSQLPLSGDSSEYGVLVERTPDANAQGGVPAFRYSVSPGYIEALGIPLRAGRLLESRDDGDAPRVALVSESLAKKFVGRDLVGERIRIGSADMPWYTIVGTVGDVKQTSLAADRTDAVYVTPEQWRFADNPMSLVVRATGNAGALATAVRNAIWSVDRNQPVTRIATMDTLVAETASERRFALILFEAFSVVALLLSAIGIYGVLAGSVTERTREIGVRAALGATRASILSLVLRQGLTLTVFGAVIGLVGGALASRGLVALLFNTSRFDLATYAGVATLLMLVATLACWVPAWRAARVDPTTALRAE